MSFSFFSKKDKNEEKRGSLRREKVFIAQCEVNEKKSFSTIIDISSNGLGVYLEYPINIGTRINITLQYQFINGAYSSRLINLTLPAKVIWIREETAENNKKNSPLNIEDIKYRAGLEFINVPENIKEKFDALLKK